ncbi:MAG: PAS domain-containing protein [Ardenticatenaceae bacterium]|nr:PAS domain-containing protein [Ardenticatenaceae bacterium]MCB9444185.1 PAS domain-containing protein [Ardenticatenaceae bacterium]
MNVYPASDLAQSQQILEHLADGIIFSNQNGYISYANGAACMMVGRPISEIVGYPITDILTRLPLLASSADHTKSSRFELNGRYLRGKAVVLYNQSNEAEGILTTLHDITAEFELEQSKDSFLQTISHELRTPLTAIKGYVELLSTGASGTLNDSQKMFTTTIQRNVNRMVQLINSLIFASSIKAGRLEYITGHTDLTQLIDQISRELQPTAAEDGQKIVVEVAKEIQPLHVDPIHMATILEELITNSIKFNRPGGTVRVTAVPDTMNGNAQTYIIVSVSDEGIGIDPADQSHIFEEFYRATHETESHIRTRGLGMGLSIVRALVETYNGRIWFKSTPGQGSTFTFIIPNQPAEEVTPAPNIT